MSRRRDQSGDVAPLLVFALLLLVVALLGAGIALTRGAGEGADPAAAPAPTDDHQLTDTEAIARFKELDALRVDALEERNVEGLRLLYTPDSPDLRRGRSSIRRLRQDDVIVDELWEVENVEVLRNNALQIDVRVVATSDARFFSETGIEVTKRSRRERQTVRCSLHFLKSEWLLHECTILNAETVGSS